MLNLNTYYKNKIIFDSRYQLTKKLGGGGFSEVWLAYDVKSQTNVALKVYVQAGDLDEDGIAMFRNEFSIVCQFNHSNILRPNSFEIIDGHPYLVLPYCEYGSASQFVGNIKEDDVWKFIKDVASGLDYLHSNLDHPVVHQDIKPANILIDINHDFVITDFGISTSLHRTLSRKQSPSENDKSGTLAYMAPERFEANAIPLISNDIWSLGATLYELVTGDVPFGDFGGLTQSKVHKVNKIGGNYSKELKHLIALCLSEETWNRPTAEQLVEAAAKRRIDKVLPKKKWNEMYKGAILLLLLAPLIYLWIKPDPINPVNPNPKDLIADDYLLQANRIIDFEWNAARGGQRIDSINEDHLNEAIVLYNGIDTIGCSDSLKLAFSEHISKASFKIDSIRNYFERRRKEYNSMNALNAEKEFSTRLKRIKLLNYKPNNLLGYEKN